MFGSSLPPVVCRRAYVLFTCVVVFLSSSCVPYVASFSGLFIFDCPSVFANVYLFHDVTNQYINKECQIGVFWLWCLYWDEGGYSCKFSGNI